MNKITPMRRLSFYFDKFESKFNYGSRGSFNGSAPKRKEVDCTTYISRGVSSDFIRVYEFSKSSDSVGFAFNNLFKDDVEDTITVSLFLNDKRYYKEFNFQEFKDIFKVFVNNEKYHRDDFLSEFNLAVSNTVTFEVALNNLKKNNIPLLKELADITKSLDSDEKELSSTINDIYEKVSAYRAQLEKDAGISDSSLKINAKKREINKIKNTCKNQLLTDLRRKDFHHDENLVLLKFYSFNKK